jgi:hypothetical protein
LWIKCVVLPFRDGILSFRVMAFVRYKTVKGRKYYQYVRNYREAGRHKQEVLCHLGPHESLDEAIDYHRHMVQTHLETAASWEKEAKSTKAYLFEFYGDELADKIPSSHEAYLRWELFQEDRDVNLFEIRDGFFYQPSTLTDEEWRAEWHRWEERRRYEEGLLDAVRDYHRANSLARSNRRYARSFQGKLDRFTRVQQEYS